MHELSVEWQTGKRVRWTSARVHRALTAAAGSLSFTAVDLPGPVGPIQRGASILAVLDDGPDAVAVGEAIIDEVGVELSGEDFRLSFAARDLPGQLVDCTPLEPQTWHDVALHPLVAQIADEFRVRIDADLLPSNLKRFQTFATQAGETAFEAIERACRMRGVLATARSDGRLALMRPSRKRASVRLTERNNVLALTARYRVSERFARYEVVGQEPLGEWDEAEKAVTPHGTAFDPAIAGHRTRLILAETIVNSETALERARWEATVAQARGSAITIKVNGWREKGNSGPLWEPGVLVPVQLPTLKLSRDLLVDEVVLSMDPSSGWTTELRLVRADAYLPVPGDDQDPAAALEGDS